MIINGWWDANANITEQGYPLYDELAMPGSIYSVIAEGDTRLGDVSNWRVGDFAFCNEQDSKWEVMRNYAEEGVSTTNSLTSLTNLITSNVNGVSSSANIINSNALNLTGATLKSTVNGVDSSTVTVQPLISGAINNNIVTTSATGQVKDSGYSINSTNPYEYPISSTQLADTLSTYNFVTSIANVSKGLQPVTLYFDTNQTLSGLPTQGDYTCATGDRVICAGQTDTSKNLIYIVASGSWTEAPDSNTVNELLGAWVSINKGTYATNYTYLINVTPSSGVVPPTSVTWSTPVAQGLYQAGTGLSLVGSVFSITNTAVTAGNYAIAGNSAYTVNSKGQITSATNVTQDQITGLSTLGMVKRSGTNTLAIATSGTDYSAGTSGLSTGILKSTTTTGELTIASAADFPLLNQNTTGSAGSISGTNIITDANIVQSESNTWYGNNTNSLANKSSNVTSSITEATSSVLTITGGSNAALNPVTIQVKEATASQNGYLSSTDWTTFNNKQAALTNPVTSSASSGSANQLAVFTGTGDQVTPTTTLPTTSFPAMAGDVQNSAGNLTNTIQPNVVSNSKLSKAGANTYKGNATGSTADVTDITTNTAFNKNFETNTSNIKMDGAVSVGSSGNVVNSDHVHPSDTSKQNIIATPTANDLVSVNNAGQVIDSGISVSTVSTTSSDTVLLTSKATQTAIANAITSSENLRGGYDASSNTFPTTGGTGLDGAIEAGNYWYITVQGTLGSEVVPVGSSITALIDTPGQTSSNWLIIQDAVNSVFGRTGLVTAQTGDYNFSQIVGTNTIIQGGTGATTQQAAINALTGTQSAGKYVRSDGTNAVLANIQAGDVPTLNQNTTGTAANITATSNSTLTGLPNLSLLYSQLSGTVPTWNQSTTGNASTATNLAGGVANNISYQTAANTTSFIAPVNNAILGTNGSGVPSFSTYAQVNSALAVNTNTQYVTPLGSDTNNGYTPSTGVATLGQALTNLGNVAGIIFISPKVGGYSGDYTITSQNINIVSLSPNQAVDFNGTLTFSHTASNVQLNNISCEILNHTGAGALYMFGGSVTTSLTSSGAGYLYTSGVDLQATATTVSITGAKSVVFTNATALGQLTINNPSAIVSLLNCLNSKAITLTSGVVGINNSTIYSASAGANAISVSPEAFFFATNSTFLVTNTTTPALINVDAGSVYSISNCAYSDSSVIAGTMLTRTGKFDAIALTTALPFASGGTGAKTRQAALNALASTVTTGQYLRGNGTNISMSAIQASDVPTLNQNTTGTASSVTGTNVVTNTNLSTMPTNTLKGNNTGSTATPIDLTSTQVTGMLDTMVGDSGSGGTKGLTPAPGAGDGEAGKFLKADGTWAIPNGSGTSATYFRSYNIGATNGTAIQTITTTGTANWLTVTAAAQRLILNGNTLQNGGFTNSAVNVTIPTSGIYTITYTVTTTVIGLTNREIWVQLVKTTGGTPLAILASAELNGGSNNNGEITITYTGAFTVGDIIDLRMETIAGTPNVGINSYSLLINALAVPSAITETFTVGDTKTGLQSADHSNWLLWTNGRTLSRATYATLWNFVNTNSLVATGLFGAGDGATTFTLGNINGRAIGITGSGTGLTARTLGASVGTETQTLTTANLPSHNHNIFGDSGSGIGSGSTSDRVLLNTDGDVRNVLVKTTELTGSGTAHNNMQPTVFLNFFIYAG